MARIVMIVGTVDVRLYGRCVCDHVLRGRRSC